MLTGFYRCIYTDFCVFYGCSLFFVFIVFARICIDFHGFYCICESSLQAARSHVCFVSLTLGLGGVSCPELLQSCATWQTARQMQSASVL